MKTILRRLKNARDWIAIADDRRILQEIVAGCIKLLQSSVSNYNAWAARHASKIKKLDRSAVAKLIDLTISDVEASSVEYRQPWQLDQFGQGDLVAKAKRAKACTCQECGRKHYPARRSKYCSRLCQNRAACKARRAKKAKISAPV